MRSPRWEKITKGGGRYEAGASSFSDGNVFLYPWGQQFAMTEMNPAGQTGNLVKFDYDPAGRLAAERSGNATTAYSYGLFEKVAAVTKPDGSQVAFNYWPDGQMAGKSRITNPSTPSPAPADQEPKGFLWDGLALLDQGDSSFTVEPHVCGGVPLAETSAKSAPIIVISDFLGTTIGFVEGEGFTPTPLTAFGEQTANLASSRQASGRLSCFTGKHFDTDIKAYNFLFRNFRPDMARWVCSDPEGFPDGLNNFLYTNNKTTFAYDTLGKDFALTTKYTSRDPKNKMEINRIKQDGEYVVNVWIGGSIKFNITRQSDADPIQLYVISYVILDGVEIESTRSTITFSNKKNDKVNETISAVTINLYKEPDTVEWALKIVFLDSGTQKEVASDISSSWIFYIE